MRSTRGGLASVVLLASLPVACGSTPNFEGATTGGTGIDRDRSLSLPIPPGDGPDLLLAILGIASNPNTTGPDGWTPVPGFAGFNGATCQADGQGTACQLSVYYRVADGSETAATFTWGAPRGAAGAVVRYSNIDPAGPIGVTRPNRGSSDAPTAPVVTTTRAGSRVVRIVAVELDEVKPFLTGSVAMSDEAPTSRLNFVSFPDAATDPARGCGPPLSRCDATDRGIALGISDTRHPGVEGSGPAAWELPAPDQWLGASIEILRAPAP